MTKLLTNEELYHFGTLGMKWGIRKYQYEDGTLTPEGIERYRKGKKKLETLEKAKERHDTRAAKADYIRATTRSVNKAVRKDKVQAKEHLRSITTENKIKKTIKKIESSLGMTMGELEKEYGENAILSDKNKRLVDDLIDRYSDTCAGEDRSHGMAEAKEELERLFPRSKDSISKLVDENGKSQNDSDNVKDIPSDSGRYEHGSKTEPKDPNDDRSKEEIEHDNFKISIINKDSDLRSMFNDKFRVTKLDPSKESDRKHYKDVANLGLKALIKQDTKHYGSSDLELDKGWREWFMYEDQTIGMPLVAHYVINGFPAKKIEKLISEVGGLSYYQYGYGPNSNVVFELNEGNNGRSLADFAEECEKVLKEEKKK